jgi:hypothetical protein
MRSAITSPATSASTSSSTPTRRRRTTLPRLLPLILSVFLLGSVIGHPLSASAHLDRSRTVAGHAAGSSVNGARRDLGSAAREHRRIRDVHAVDVAEFQQKEEEKVAKRQGTISDMGNIVQSLADGTSLFLVV